MSQNDSGDDSIRIEMTKFLILQCQKIFIGLDIPKWKRGKIPQFNLAKKNFNPAACYSLSEIEKLVVKNIIVKNLKKFLMISFFNELSYLPVTSALSTATFLFNSILCNVTRLSCNLYECTCSITCPIILQFTNLDYFSRSLLIGPLEWLISTLLNNIRWNQTRFYP